MEEVFVYGTLLQPKYQKEAWGRVVKGKPATLSDYKKYIIVHNKEPFPVAVPEIGGMIQGRLLSLTLSELKKLDRYESSIYQRKKIILRDGVKAWMYVLG